MRKLVMLLVIVMIPFGYAMGHGPHHHDVIVGPAGEDGIDGRDGVNGSNGSDAELETRFTAGVEARVFDHKHFSINIFDDYDLRDGFNERIGARVVFKIGSSYEGREIEKLQEQINYLKSIAHKPAPKKKKEPVCPEGCQ